MANHHRAQIAVIGGSGFYHMDGLTEVEAVNITTPFGAPSDAIVLGTLDGVRVAFLPRHGVGHRLLPAEVPARANIYALKTLGVQRIIAVSAVGSLREEIEPLHLVIPDQIIDRTRGGRPSTFFGRGLVAHISFADPFCPTVSQALWESGQSIDTKVHRGGTYIAIEGPPFSTRAESDLYRSWGASLIGMTALPEAKLAREAEICYSILACVTDYDTWHDRYQTVTAEIIIANLNKAVASAQQTVRSAVQRLPEMRDCPCAHALKDALVTPPHLVPAPVKTELRPIIGRYMQ